jgi:hypothetical protein
MSVTVDHTSEAMSITVTSTRPQDDDLPRLRVQASLGVIHTAARRDGSAEHRRHQTDPIAAQLEAVAWADELTWENVTVPVDGQPVIFQIYEMTDGWWAAVGQVADVDLSLIGGNFPSADIALARATDLAVPRLRPHRDRRPQTRACQIRCVREDPLTCV